MRNKILDFLLTVPYDYEDEGRDYGDARHHLDVENEIVVVVSLDANQCKLLRLPLPPYFHRCNNSNKTQV